MMIQFDGAAPFAEGTRVGREVRIGGATIRIVEECIHCAVTTVEPGSIRVGDADGAGLIPTFG